jgi:hypothetical protein
MGLVGSPVVESGAAGRLSLAVLWLAGGQVRGRGIYDDGRVDGSMSRSRRGVVGWWDRPRLGRGPRAPPTSLLSVRPAYWLAAEGAAARRVVAPAGTACSLDAARCRGTR